MRRRAPLTIASLCQVLVAFATLATAALLVGAQVLHTQMLMEERVSLDYYIEGAASKPFAYRVLIPKALQSLDVITPHSMAPVFDRLGERIVALGSLSGNFPSAVDARARSGPENKYPRAIFWLAALQFAALIGYALVGASLYATLFPASRWCPLIAPLLLLLLLPIVEQGIGHIYDFSVLLFVACLLRAMAGKRHLIYLAIFSAGCLNKETTVFVSLAYAAVFYGRMPVLRYALMLAAQASIFLLIYMSVRVSFADNLGADMEVRMHLQLEHYLRQPPSFYATVAVLAFSLSFRWNEKPLLLRQFMAMVPLHVILLLYAAYPGELRNWYESMPLLSMFFLRNAECICEQWWVPPTSASQLRGSRGGASRPADGFDDLLRK